MSCPPHVWVIGAGHRGACRECGEERDFLGDYRESYEKLNVMHSLPATSRTWAIYQRHIQRAREKKYGEQP